MTATRLAALDLPEANAMRAPGEATGLMALEIAIDEMAEKLGLDPIEFRVRNDTQVVPDQPGRASRLTAAAAPLFATLAGAMSATGGRTFRLEQAQLAPGHRTRRALADRHRCRGGYSRQSADEVGCARASRS